MAIIRRGTWLRTSMIAVVAAGLGGAACDSTGEMDATTGGVAPCVSPVECGADAGADCESAFNDFCGQPCTGDADCGGTLLYCADDGMCTADCTAGGDQCVSGETCTSVGRCDDTGTSLFPDSGLGAGGTGNGNNGGDGCISFAVGFEPQTPTVLVLLDQSGSMDENFGNGMDRWDTMKDVLLAEADGVIYPLQNDVRFGLMLYSSENGFEDAGICPMLASTPLVNGDIDYKFGNYSAIFDLLDPAEMIEDTPTAESLRAAAESLGGFNAPGPKIIILATDGDPDTCEVPDPSTDEAKALSEAAVADIYDDGVQTYVISIGNDVTEDHLTNMAHAGVGQGPDGDASFYRPSQRSDMIAAFNQIINGVRGCIYDLNGSVAAEDQENGTITIGSGDPLVFNDPDGWRMNTPSQIELVGQACTDLENGVGALGIDFPCGEFIPIN